MNFPFLLVAALLAAYGLLALFLVSDRPDRPLPTRPLIERLVSAGRLLVTWELSALYAVGFGGIVAFGVYLPTYLKNLYHLSQTEAGTKAAGFALLAVLLRPVGGWLSDRIHPSSPASPWSSPSTPASTRSAPSRYWAWPPPSAPPPARCSPW